MNIELKARTKARVLGIPLMLTKKKLEPKWSMRFGINTTRKQLENIVGENMAHAVFSSFMAGEEGNGNGDGTWMLKEPKPVGQCEMHKITIDDISISTKPKIREFQPIKDTEKVQMVVSVGVGKAQMQLLMKMIKKQGNECDFEIEPSLQDLPLDKGQVAANLSEKPKILKGGKK